MTPRSLTLLVTIGVPLIFSILTLLFGSWVTIPAGHRGVVLRMGAVTGRIMPEGFNTKMPLLHSVQKMEVRVTKEEVNTQAASKDLQIVSTTIAANLRLDASKCASLYQNVGMEYSIRIVDPAMQETIKAAVARYTAEELVTKREAVRQDIKALLVDRLSVHGILLEEVNIVNFDFSKSFNDSIEAKVTAEQNALTAKNKLEQVKFEAQQKIEEAKGKAEAITVEAAALRDNPTILTLRALEKWNGVLPRVTGTSVPFINVDSLESK